MVGTAKHARIALIWGAVLALTAGTLVLAASCSPATENKSPDAPAASEPEQTDAGEPAASEPAGDAGSEAKAIESSAAWSMASDCSMCHTSQHDSFGNTAMRASIHAALDCTSCHSDEAGLTKVHEKADASKAGKITRLRRTTINQDLCFTCHGSWEDLAAKTAEIKLVDREDTAVNPHALPDTPTHAESVTCGNCHKMHSEQDAETTQVDAKELCISCHHENVFACHTCHD